MLRVAEWIAFGARLDGFLDRCISYITMVVNARGRI